MLVPTAMQDEPIPVPEMWVSHGAAMSESWSPSRMNWQQCVQTANRTDATFAWTSTVRTSGSLTKKPVALVEVETTDGATGIGGTIAAT
mmetsp:Transcript_36380/g.70053  ORF Transcript_36380/g.70053 Transcript_36380/m.70053 type:complete len:89 (-) Transcript_36380:230-496(-)